MGHVWRLALVCLCLFSTIQARSQVSSTLSPSNLADPSSDGKKSTPNILFIIMDDVGIDQMDVFGYGGGTPPLIPNIRTVAQAGVRFRNVWAMPECSPSRAIFFEGRFPLRTNVQAAILTDDLANSQVSPFEVTTPEILRTKNYVSGLFGKFHLAGPNNNEFTYGTPHVLGWDYFDGFLEGAPHPIDTTIGGQITMTRPDGSPIYTCGFVPNRTHDPIYGSDHGACVQLDKSCTELTRSTTMPDPGFSCVQQKGIYVRDKSCADAANVSLDFSLDNAYYAWERVINEPDGTVMQIHPDTSTTARGYVSDATANSAADWINQQNAAKKPWMTTVSFANDHTPYQQPPGYLLPGPTPDTVGFSCTGNSVPNFVATRVISNQMIEAMDTEIGNLLVSTGIAHRNADGSLDYHPEQTNTMVIIIGDNGTFAPGVKDPFDPNRAKGYVYQTGVWVPLIISGPLVASPNREVKSMVNIADLFQLFGEIAGVDVRKVVPKTHTLDSQPMLAYLTKPNQPSIRTTNFTQTGNNIHVETPPPCVISTLTSNTCVQLFNAKQICNFEGGVWYGTGSQAPDGTVYSSCCAVKRALFDPTNTPLTLLPISQEATRDDNYKLVRKEVEVCAKAPSTDDTMQTYNEFYAINENPPQTLEIDKENMSLCGESTTGVCPTNLTKDQTKIFNQLTDSMNTTLASEPACPGDGNLDKMVNLEDLTNWLYFSTHGVPQQGEPPNTSSWYDFNHDGSTDEKDLQQYILPNFGTNCLKK
jgi:arylsulfatase A-like enzyme